MRNISIFLRLALVLLLVTLAACGKNSRDEKLNAMPIGELYQTAKNSERGGNYSNAVYVYKRLISRFPFGAYTEQAALGLAYSEFKSYEPEDALSTVNRFIKTYPTHKHIDYAFYLRGLINFNREANVLERYIRQDQTRRDLGYSKQAFADFSELIKRFPDSRYAQDARLRMIYLRNSMARGELNIAGYYFRREAYIAAINRSKYVIENFAQTPQMGEALAITTESYKQLGEEKLSADTRRVLELNFPDHPYLKGDWPNYGSIWWQLIPLVGENKSH